MDNLNNKLIRRELLENIINKYIDIYNNKNNIGGNKSNVKINNLLNIQRAFIHKSFCNTNIDTNEISEYSCIDIPKYLFGNYERIEFLGDKVIDFITAEYLFDKYPDKDQGFLTDMKSRLVRKESLSELGSKLGFKEYILISSHMDKIKGRDNSRFLEDIFESFIGILYKDQHSNIELCRRFLIGIYIEHIDFDSIIKNNINYKATILQYFHTKEYSHPVYTNIYHMYPVYNRVFVSLVFIPKALYDNNPIEGINVSEIQDKILQVIKTDCSNAEISDTQAYNNTCKMMKDGILLGIGRGGTKKISEQECSKNFLLNIQKKLKK